VSDWIDVPKTARERSAELIGLLVKDFSSQQALLDALSGERSTNGPIPADDVTDWLNAVSLPPVSLAGRIAELLGEYGEEFLQCWRIAQRETEPEVASTEDLAIPRGISVLGIVWLGVCAESLDESCRFYEEVLRLNLVHRCERDHAIFRTVNGDYVALFGPGADRHKFFTTGPVAGFRVGNVAAARSEMERSGVMFLGPTLANDNGRWKYAHFLGPDRNVYEIVEEDPWPESGR
jgi:catechol 2,3-dioxygenase-like lactoylglutathione lyase family enzyme